jgi:hypothetical protein
MHARSSSRLSGTQAATVRFHHPDRRRFLDARRQFAAAILLRLFVALPRQVGADLLGQTLDVAAADGHIGGDLESYTDQVKRLQLASEREDTPLEIGGIAMAVQAQGGP